VGIRLSLLNSKHEGNSQRDLKELTELGLSADRFFHDPIEVNDYKSYTYNKKKYVDTQNKLCSTNSTCADYTDVYCFSVIYLDCPALTTQTQRNLAKHCIILPKFSVESTELHWQ